VNIIDGEVYQKPMSKTRHSKLQGKLMNAIIEVAKAGQVAYAFPELRCTFGDCYHYSRYRCFLLTTHSA
jgi:Uma2 family endonuclease